jgi:hypothetical protein
MNTKILTYISKFRRYFTCHILYKWIRHTVALHINSNNQCQLPVQVVRIKHYLTWGTYVSVKGIS